MYFVLDFYILLLCNVHYWNHKPVNIMKRERVLNKYPFIWFVT